MVNARLGNLMHLQPQPLLTPKQVAEILGVSVGTLTVWRSTNRYQLPWIKVGSLVMYEPASVEAFIDARRQIPAATLESRYSTMDRDALVEVARLFAEQVIDDLIDHLPFEHLAKRKAADLGEGTAAEVMSNMPGGPYESNTKTQSKSSRSG